MPLQDKSILNTLAIFGESNIVGQFILGQSIIGGNDRLGAGYEEISLLPEAIKSVVIERGVEANFASPKPFIGSMTASLKNPKYLPYVGQDLQCLYFGTDGAFITLFTGRVSTFTEDVDETTGDSTVTFTALDRVNALANTMRYGSQVPGIVLVEQTEPRVQRLLAGQSKIAVTNLYPWPWRFTVKELRTVTEATNLRAWTMSEGAKAQVYPGTGTFTLTPGLDKPTTRGDLLISDLIPGNYYQLSLFVDVAGGNGKWGIDQPLPTNPMNSGQTEKFGFIAKSENAIFTIEGTGFLSGNNFKLFDLGTNVDLHTSTVHESTLANHLDQVAAGEGKSGWWVDSDGVLQFSGLARDTTAIAPHSTWQVKTDANIAAGEIELMAGLARRSSSQDVINQVAVSTHQIQWGTDGRVSADDRTDGPYTDPTSQATYVPAAITLDTQLGDSRWAKQVAEDLMARMGTAKPRITQVRMSGQQGPSAPIAKLEPFDRLVLTIGTRPSETLTVASIRHTITADRWLTTVTPLPM